VTDQRLSNRQIATLRHVAICTSNDGQVTLTREQREAMTPLWRRGLVEIWFRHMPDPPSSRGPFYRLTIVGQHLIDAILVGTPRKQFATAALTETHTPQEQK
jgi:hypothetical protein